MKLLIMPNLEKANTLRCAEGIKEHLGGHCLLMYQKRYGQELSGLGDVFSDDTCWLLGEADIVIAIGGDGTIIHAAKLAAEAGKPILGINSGHLGFTAGLEPEELGSITRLLCEPLPIERRMMLEVSVISPGGECRLCCTAINDAVITRGSLARIITLDIAENDRPALSFRADGVIVSTPTGSTAYALSAGGPVIAPQINCIPATPICPHDLSSRTVIFSDSSRLTVTTGERRGCVAQDTPDSDIYLTVDGEISCPLSYGDRVEIARSPLDAQFIKLKSMGFSEILKAKFSY